MYTGWTLVQNGIVQWVEENTPVGTKVFWSEQDIGRPQTPFVCLKIIDVHTVNNSSLRPAVNGQRATYGTREFTLNLSFFGSYNVMFELESLLTSLSKVNVREKLHLNDVIVFDVGAIRDLTFLETPLYKSRADASLRCRTSVNASYGGNDATIIESVNVSGIIDEKEINSIIPNP